ncbi:aldose 1-epimerase [Derxia gummosa]|uniref:Aldose 1-epimerase n=1 Tax=Derxia gummosa DSM 723 TaxID=1121388 RepID=A0A8B6XAN1_9BURK|nr:aldose 1-epimerase [Derxia gummosa]
MHDSVPPFSAATGNADFDAALDLCVNLAAGELRLAVTPEVGGCIAAFFSQTAAGLLHWMRPATRDALVAADPLGMGSFPLVPFCNRIRDGRSDAAARPVRLRQMLADVPHALHGLGWRRPWRVTARAAASLTITFTHDGDGGWPWRFEAWQRFDLAPDALTVTLGLRNLDGEVMPAGLGHHPYYPRDAATRLTTSVATMWEADDTQLPTRQTVPNWLARLPRGIEVEAIYPGITFDNNFTGWSREARIDWPGRAQALCIEAGAPLDYALAYVPAGKDFFCFEPVSNVTDWMNLAATGERDVGGHWLAPGEMLETVTRFVLKAV